jgi:glutamate N-acetyltransferase/amino-acid N-acetyltransferase
MAIGKAKQKVNLNRFSLDIGSFNIVSEGELNEKYDETDTTLIYMQKNDVIDIFVNLGVTDDIHNQSTITTCDLSKGYIEINADYRS